MINSFTGGICDKMENKRYDFIDKVEDISNLYINELQPLLILIETNEQTYPIEILNETRCYCDHISKCFNKNITNEQKDKNIKNAYEHVVRAVICCYKTLISHNLKLLKNLEKEYPTVDFHDVDNGDFYPKYYLLETDVKEGYKTARQLEIEDKTPCYDIMTYYKEVFNTSNHIKEFINENRSKIEWTRLKYRKQKIRSKIAWLISIIVTCILTNNNQQILEWLINLFENIKNLLGK